MYRAFFVALVLSLPAGACFPAYAFAARPPATFSAANALLAASSSPGNAYAAGTSIVVTAPVAGDLSAAGGSIVIAAPVQGDGLLLGGSISSRARVGGDLRTAGGSVNIDEPVTGDLIAFGYSVHDAGRAGGSVFIAAANVDISNGAAGPVTIYGNNVSLSGDFSSDVRVVASGQVMLAASTTIVGRLSYEAPEPATIPTAAVIRGGIDYTSASYLPSAGTSRMLSFVSVGFFIFVRVLSALILAGLLAGLFPRLAEAIVLRIYMRPRSILLTMLLGFGVIVAVPVLLILLSLTFVGLGLAFLLLILYALLVLLALLYAGILLGMIFVRRFVHRDTVLWRDGVVGMLALSLIALVPFVGLFVVLLFTIFTAGTLLQLFFQFAFPHEDTTAEML